MLIPMAVVIASACSAAAGAADRSEIAGGTAVIAEIDGVKLTRAEFEGKRYESLFQARNAFFEAERKAVDEFINDYLLERQAQKEKLTVTELLERHVNGAIEKDPAEDVLRVYYEGIDTTEPYEAMRGKIIEAIRQRRLAKAKASYMQSLRSAANISLHLAPPRAGVSLKDVAMRGPQDAPVVLVEYADYECPYCQQIQPVLQKLETEYKGRLAFVYKDVPLPMHTHAEKAAEASQCAASQGKYWEYHDLLFETKQFEISQLKANARTLKLDGAAFDKCLDGGEKAEVVQRQLTEAQGLGIPGTPGFFVNGRFINPNGSIGYDTLRQVVEEELRAASAAKAGLSSGAGPAAH
jgi:protein-disulfide isomerase